MSIIIRGWHFENELSDVWVLKNLEEAKSIVVSARLFSKRSTFLFVLVLSVTPAFYLVSIPQSTNVDIPWIDGVSVLSLSIGIIVTTLITYQMIFRFSKRSSGGGSQLVFISLAFLFFSVLGLYISPLKEFSITFFDIYNAQVPLIMMIIIFPLSMLVIPYALILVVYPLIDFTYRKLRKWVEDNYRTNRQT